MVSLLEALPVELVGTNLLQFLPLKDILMVERACGSKKSHQLFDRLIQFYQPVKLPCSYHENKLVLVWFVKKQCKLQSLTVELSGSIPWLIIKNLEVDCIDLQIDFNTTIEILEPLLDCNKGCKVRSISVYRNQNKDIMEQLSACTRNVKQLAIDSLDKCMDWLTVDMLSKWKLTEIEFDCSTITTPLVLLIVQTCSELTSIKLYYSNIDDSAVSAIAQHCPKLETLLLLSGNITWTSLVSLSERGLPLEELYIDPIPNIPTADIARRCSHALSRIQCLHTGTLYNAEQDANILTPYLTGLANVILDHFCQTCVPLLTQYCHKITKIDVWTKAYTVEDILSLCRANPLLQELYCEYQCGFTQAILTKLIHACPHLHTLRFPYETDITDTGIVALSGHCPQLQCLHINKCHKVTEEAVLQLLQRCHKLTRLEVSNSSLSEETWTQLDRNTQKKVSRC